MTFEEFKNKKGEITVVEEAATFTNFDMDKLNNIEGLVDDDNKSSGSDIVYYNDVIKIIKENGECLVCLEK